MIGETVGSYRIVRRLGEGGMGTVSEATHLHSNRSYAIKVLKPDVPAHADAVRSSTRCAPASNAASSGSTGTSGPTSRSVARRSSRPSGARTS